MSGGITKNRSFHMETKRVGLVQLKAADKGNTNTVQQGTWPSINSTAKHPASQNPTFCKSLENPTQISQ